MSKLRKALAAGLTPANIISWLSLKWMAAAGAFTGTLRLRLKAALVGAKIGKGVKAYGPVSLLRWPGGSIEIGDNVSIISSWRRATACALAHPTRLRVFGAGAAIKIGSGVEISGASITARSKTIVIGPNTLIGPNCIIVDSDFHAPWPAETRSFNPGYENDAAVSIGANCWLGMSVMVLKGASIGEGAIIGAGSVVTGVIPSFSVAAGVPARVIAPAGDKNGQ